MRYSKQTTTVMTIQLLASRHFLAFKMYNNVEIKGSFEQGLKLLNYTATDLLQSEDV
jgi:hypothetical protein